MDLAITFVETQEPKYGGGTEPFYRAEVLTHAVVVKDAHVTGRWMRSKKAALRSLFDHLAGRDDLADLLGVDVDR